MPKTVVDFPVFDADNHMYETTDAFTKFLPKEYDGLVKYVQVNGRTKIAVRNVISDYIPNPTFEVVGRPGAQEAYFKEGNPEGKSRRELIGEAMRSPEGFFAPEPRLKIMDELGIDRALMWPTLASLLEERLADDPKATHAVVHALNQWMLEHWTFNYEGRIFPTPIITLPIVTEAIKELEWVVERGAKIILVRPAPVPGYEGRRSFAYPSSTRSGTRWPNSTSPSACTRRMTGSPVTTTSGRDGAAASSSRSRVARAPFRTSRTRRAAASSTPWPPLSGTAC